MNGKTDKTFQSSLKSATDHFSDWVVKQFGRTDLSRRVSLLTWYVFLILAAAVFVLGFWFPDCVVKGALGPIGVGILTNLLAASILSVVAAGLWWANSRYKEKEFTIHTFNYSTSENVRRKRKRLALEISEGVETQTNDPCFSRKLIGDEDESKLRIETAAEFAAHNSGHIAIVPFMEIARAIGEIFRAPKDVPSARWERKSEVEVGRTFAIFVTYDPVLEEKANKVRNLRFFSTPRIDVQAMFNDMIDNPGVTHIVLLGDKEGEFENVEQALRVFVNQKVARLRRFEKLTKLVVDADDYVPQKDDRICLFVMSVDPSESVLKRIKEKLDQATTVDASVLDIYVLPTWVRNWVLDDDGEKKLLAYWDDWLRDRKLTTALPEGIALDRKNNWADDGRCFDIILFYTRHAIDLAIAARKQIQATGGTRYDRTASELDKKVHSVFRAYTTTPEYCFLAAFRDGDVFYEPIIVKYAPNVQKTNFTVELGKRPVATTQAPPSVSINSEYGEKGRT